MNKEKEYIEPEIIKDGQKDNKTFYKKSVDFGKNYSSEKAREKIGGIKKIILLKGLMLILPFILISSAFFVVLFLIIFLVFANPFDYIIVAILVFFMIRIIWKLYKVLNIRK